MVNQSVRQWEGKKLPLVEEFFSIQGEGFHSGKAAWFIRLAGCDVRCEWCDTSYAWDPDDFPEVNTDIIIQNAVNSGSESVVVTGGEPFMWNLDYLCSGLKKNNIKTFVETSGAWALSGKWDWICLSPKRNKPPGEEICSMADELKIIIADNDDFSWAEKYRLLVRRNCHLFLQPEWNRINEIIPDILSYIRKNQEWRISLQIHKYLKIP